jgi:integrase
VSGTGLSAADVIVTPEGITVYPPDAEGKPWRAVWYDPDGERRGCRATTESAMAAKLEPIKARIITEAHRTKAPVSQLVAHYLNPSRRPVDKQWAESTRYFETRRCQKILDAIGDRPCESVKMADMQRLVNAESTATTGDKMMYTLKALVKMGYADGFITNPRLAMVHWQAGDRPMPLRKVQHAGEAETFIDPRTLPAHPAVAVLAAATQQRRASKWWEELFIYTAAYTGLRSGELRALRADRLQFSQRLIDVLEKVVEVNGKQTLGLPKGDKIRTTLFPRRTPTGYLLAEQLARRAEEVRAEQAEGSNPLGLMFPARGGVHKREHSFHTTTLKPAYQLAG